MNKKIILIPTMLLLLAGCGGNNNPTSTSQQSSTSEEIQLNHGTLEAPLTVAEFITEADKAIQKETGTYAPGRFYVKGLNKGISPWATSSSAGTQVYSSLHLFDNEITDEEGLPVFLARRAVTISADTIYTEDELIISGRAEYYDGRYTIYPDGDDVPVVEQLNVGQVELRFNEVEHATISGKQEKYENGENHEFTITPEEGYKIRSVTYRGTGVDVTAEGKFTLLINGSADVNVVVVPNTLEEEDLPAGDYSVTITKANSALPTDTAKAEALDIKYYLKDESNEHIYKPLNVHYDASGAFNTSLYDEFKINKGKNALLTAPNGVISTIVGDFYSSQTCDVYKGTEDLGENSVKGVAGEPSEGHSSSAVKTFTIEDQNCLIAVEKSASYAQAFYSLTINIHVA